MLYFQFKMSENKSINWSSFGYLIFTEATRTNVDDYESVDVEVDTDKGRSGPQRCKWTTA